MIPNPCSRSLFSLFALALALLAPSAARAAAAGSGVIAGTVSNTATGNLLEGARVSVPALGVEVLTDATGLYVLSNLPGGSHELVVSYIGLDPVRASVAVAAASARRATSILRPASTRCRSSA